MLILPPWLSITLSVIWLLLSIVSLVNALYAFRPARKGAGFIFGFFSSWLTMELAGHLIALQVLGTMLAAVLGLIPTLIGGVATVVSVAAIGVLAKHLVDGGRARDIMAEALGADLPQREALPIPVTKLLQPFNPRRKGVKVETDITFCRVAGRKLKLDVFEPASDDKQGPRRPAIIQIHGGAWIIGDKREQALPLLNHLAANGWVCFNVNYRLSPAATWPDHLIDVKKAIAWVREHADEYHIDPNFICVTGGSAGGHITAMVALTENDPQYQAGFEDADTSVAAAVPIYGVYDLTDRLHIMGKFWRYKAVEPLIMKKFLDDEPEAFSAASPIDLVHAEAPPMLVIHGTNDVLAPLEYARIFVDGLRETSKAGVTYAEIRGAQHGFEIFASPRCFHVVSGVERYLTKRWEDYLDGRLRVRETQRNTSQDNA